MRQLLLLSVVLLSGCIAQSSLAGGSPGLVITSFQPDLSTAYSGEDLSLELRLDNTGTSPAKITSIELLSISPKEWSSRSSCDSWEGREVPAKNFVSCVYNLKAPEIPQGLREVYKPKVRITYSYSTTAITTLFIGPSKDIRRIDDIKNLAASTQSTSGPLAIGVQTRNPIRISQGSVAFPLAITLDNIGGGVICNGECNRDTWHKVSIGFEASPNIKLAGESCGMDAQNRDIDLLNGRENELVCELTATPEDAGIVESRIIVKSDYGYITERESSVTVTNRIF